MNKQRKVVITTTYNEMGIIIDTKAEEVAQPDLQPTCDHLATDCISRQAATQIALEFIVEYLGGAFDEDFQRKLIERMNALPSAQSEKHTDERTETHACDLIDRQAAIEVADAIWTVTGDKNVAKVWDQLKDLPSVQPERTCVNCGRTVNNGGWYADGRTRCPIEEHYALPKDGYCHLWEKRNVTDDDYPERRE